MISSLASKGQDFKLRSLQFHFKVAEKRASQALHTTRIKYVKASGNVNPPSLNHALWNIGILLHKQATRAKHFDPECRYAKIILKFVL